MGRLLGVPPVWLERQRRLDFRRRAAPHHSTAHRFRSNRSAPPNPARVELVGHFRRGGRLRTEYPRGFRRSGPHRTGRWHHTGSERECVPAFGERRAESVKGTRRWRLGCNQGFRTIRHPRTAIAGVKPQSGCGRRARAVRQRQLRQLPRRAAVDTKPD